MVQDFTKAGMQAAEPTEPLTETVRTGLPPASGWAGLERGLGKLTGAVPPGTDAASKGQRKAISGSWVLLRLFRHSFFALFFGLLGLAWCYAGVRGPLNYTVLSYGLVSLALAVPFVRWALQGLRDLRAIAKA